MFANKMVSGFVSVAALLMAGAANAAAIAVPPEITDATASVAVVGAAVFGIAVGVKLYKWIRAAL
jgi:hypothetical protein